MMQSITLQSPAGEDGKNTAKQSPFLCLPFETRNKIYRYCMVEDQAGDRIRGLVQPPLTHVNRQIRSEALPIYYGQNRFLLTIPRITTQIYPHAWAEFVRMFKAFKAGWTDGRGTGSLQFIRDLNCELLPTSAAGFRHLEVCFRDIERTCIYFDPICGSRRNYNVEFAQMREQNWKDWDSVYSVLERWLDGLGASDGLCVFRLIITVIMVAEECPGATKEIHFHSEIGEVDGEVPHGSGETQSMAI